MSIKEGTPVLMADGTTQPIQNCKRGQRVYGVVSGRLSMNWINFVNEYRESQTITITTMRSIATVEPTALIGVGTGHTLYKPAAALKTGDEIKTVIDGVVALEPICMIQTNDEPSVIYEINVDGGGNVIAGGMVVR